MNLDQLTRALHDVPPAGEPDLDRITRAGNRISVRRRATATVAVAAALTAVASPWVLGAGGPSGSAGSSWAAGPEAGPADAAEQAFEREAPFGEPVGATVDVGMKFYLAPGHVRSVGGLALWAEDGPGQQPPEAGSEVLAYGARLIDSDGTLRRAGYLYAPVLTRTGSTLVRVPDQNANEPTFVGLVPATQADGGALRVTVKQTDTLVTAGFSDDAVPGYVLVWVTAAEGSAPGISLQRFTVRDVNGAVVARGGFAKK